MAEHPHGWSAVWAVGGNTTPAERQSNYYYRHRERRKGLLCKRTKENKEWFDGIRTKCSRCPETHIACLELHHRDETTKRGNLSQMIYQTWSRAVLLEEAAKCDILCANCHRKEHHERKKKEGK